MNILNKKHETWLKANIMDEKIKEELLFMTDNYEKIEDAFYKELEFGTSGMRGIVGGGTNRINIPVIVRLTQGISNFLKSKKKETKVVICYDTRKNSKEFAEKTAEVFAGNKISAYISEEPMPLSLVSFAIREMKADLGIMITASHNPKEYNGYKVYDNTGKQIVKNQVADITQHLKKVEFFDDITENISLDTIEGYKKNIPENIIEKYEETLLSELELFQRPALEKENIKIAYSSLNGAGAKVIPKMLKLAGFENVFSVKEQEIWDGEFETCPYPNPEDEGSFELAKELAEEENVDLILVTDPDSDRLAIGIPTEDGYKKLNGNEIAIILLNYIIAARKEKNEMPDNPTIVRTITTTPILDKMIEDVNGEVTSTFIGFKFIGEKINELEEQNQDNNFIFGVEESLGYLASTFARDKDGISIGLIAAMMASYYKDKDISIESVLEEEYKKHGYYFEKTLSFSREGSLGEKTITKVMGRIRKYYSRAEIAMPIKIFYDYKEKQQKIIDGKGDYNYPLSKKLMFLEPADAVEFLLENGKIIIRPSGTENKMKVYIFVNGNSREEAENNMTTLEESTRMYMEKHFRKIDSKMAKIKYKIEGERTKEEALKKELEEQREQRHLENEAEKAIRLEKAGITDEQKKEINMKKYRKQPAKKLKERK